jgi:hypothetical protein
MHETQYPHIVKKAGQPASLADWPRIRVSQIVADHLGHGWSAEEILRQYPDLTPSEVHAALAYSFDHSPEIDAELERELAEVERDSEAPPSDLRLRLRSMRRIHAA